MAGSLGLTRCGIEDRREAAQCARWIGRHVACRTQRVVAAVWRIAQVVRTHSKGEGDASVQVWVLLLIRAAVQTGRQDTVAQAKIDCEVVGQSQFVHGPIEWKVRQPIFDH